MTAQADRHGAFLAKAVDEIGALGDEGVLTSGNAFSSVLLVKAEALGADGPGPLAGVDGDALRAALGSLGYAPEDWAALSTLGASGEPLPADVLRRAVVTLDPSTVIVCDDDAAASIRDAFSEELAGLDAFEEAMLLAGTVVRVLGMRLLNLGGFEACLSDAGEKQLRWRWLKQLRPLGEPF